MKHIALAVLVLVSTPALAGACQIDKHQPMIDVANMRSPKQTTYTTASGSYLDYKVREGQARFDLHVADGLLADGCLDEAEHFYRVVLTEYDDPSLQGARDRAKVGIDDVRAAKRR